MTTPIDDEPLIYIDDAPASVDWVGDLDPTAVRTLHKAADEWSRRHGRIREMVERMLERGEEPTRADVAAAVVEDPSSPLPVVLSAHAAKLIRAELPLQTGSKAPPRETWEEIAILCIYQRALLTATDEHVAEGTRRTRAVKTRALQATANTCGLGKRTVARIVAAFPRVWLSAQK